MPTPSHESDIGDANDNNDSLFWFMRQFLLTCTDNDFAQVRMLCLGELEHIDKHRFWLSFVHEYSTY